MYCSIRFSFTNLERGASIYTLGYVRSDVRRDGEFVKNIFNTLNYCSYYYDYIIIISSSLWIRITDMYYYF